MTEPVQKNWLAGLSLLSSSATLVCCALPLTVVTLAGGATLVSLTTAVPQLIFLSEHKGVLFTVAGILLLLAGLAQWRARHAPCPADPAAALACQRARRLNTWVYALSLVFFMIGAFTAFVLPRLLI